MIDENIFPNSESETESSDDEEFYNKYDDLE
jgi:hypothetical protein